MHHLIVKRFVIMLLTLLVAAIVVFGFLMS